MRKIKFRVWNKHLTKMDQLLRLNFYYKGDQLGVVTDEGPIDSFEIMQYTGLKDKTGREIYEGDILDAPNSRIGLWVVEYIPPMFKLRCVTDTKPACQIVGQPYLKTLRGQTRELYGDGTNNEVIGNIYENPELNDSDKKEGGCQSNPQNDPHWGSERND